jgi:ribosomal protein L10
MTHIDVVEALMAVTKADKAKSNCRISRRRSKGPTADVVDFSLNVPQVTELGRQLRTAKASYRVVKNTWLARAERHVVRAAREAFQGHTAVAYTKTDPVALAKTLTTFIKTRRRCRSKPASCRVGPCSLPK